MKLDNLKQVVRNPLGIIAMFVTTVYGIACLIIESGLPMLYEHCERMWLIQFVFWFPFVLLFSFILLVIFFPTHLFGPGDYKDERCFLESLRNKDKNEKLKADVAAVKDEIRLGTSSGSSVPSPSKIPSNEELREMLQDIETKALLALNEKYGVVFRQDVKFGNKQNALYLDGYAFYNQVHYVVEIKYMPYACSNHLSLLMKQMYGIVAELKQLDIMNTTKIILCIVYGDKIDGDFHNKLKDQICRISQDIDICLFNKEELGVERKK